MVYFSQLYTFTQALFILGVQMKEKAAFTRVTR